MTIERLNYLVFRWTAHADLEDYKGYIKQLGKDHRESGTDASAEDYETMLQLIEAIEREVVS